MKAIKEVLNTISNIKKKGVLLSKEEIISILEATKTVTANKETINSLIFFYATLDLENQKNIEKLTKRELQILHFIGHGKSSKDIAKKLNLSTSTIETHRKNIRKKIDLVGKGKLVEYAILNNIIHFKLK